MSILNSNRKKSLWAPFLGIVLILTFCLLFFWKLIFSPSVISYGDNTFLFQKHVVSSWSSYFGNGMDHGEIISSYPYRIIPLIIFSPLRLSLENISKLAYFLPILISLIVIFFILVRVSRSVFFGTAGTLLFLLSSITVEYLLFFPVPYFLLIFSFFFVLLITHRISHDDNATFLYFILLALLSIFSSHPFFFFIYVLYLSFYFLYDIIFLHRSKTFFIILTFLCIIFLNFYWLFPFGMKIIKSGEHPASFYGDTNLNGIYSAYLEFTTPLKIAVGSTYPIEYMREYIFNNFSNLVSIIILITFVLLSTFRYKKVRDSFNYFLFVIYVLFFTLSFWPNNPLVKLIWVFLWESFPPFQFLRSFNRFSVVLIPIIIFSLAIHYVEKKNKKIINVILTLTIVVLLYGHKNLLNGDFGGFIPVYKIPSEYQYLNNYLVKNGGDNSRTISYPKVDYEINTWDKNNNFEQFQQIHYLLELYVDGVILQSEAPNHTLREGLLYKEIFDPTYCINKEKFLGRLSKIDIDYVLLQKDLIDRDGNIIPYQDYKNCLNSLAFSPILNNEFFEFYKVNYNSQYINNYDIKEVYPFYYAVDFDFDGRDKAELVFPQNFNSGWKLYRNDSSNSNFLQRNLIPLYNRELKIENVNNEPGNRWILKRENFSQAKINLNLYYYPQIYVFIGFTLTTITLITLIGLGVYLLIRKVRSKKYVQQSNIQI